LKRYRIKWTGIYLICVLNVIGTFCNLYLLPVFPMRIRKFLGLLDLDLLVRDPNLDLNPDYYIMKKI
jgi:hypothetical protein